MTQPCPPWCTRGSHRDEDHPEDRWHWSTEHRRILTLEKAAEIEEGEWEPEYMALAIRQHLRHAEPTITIGKGELIPGLWFAVIPESRHNGRVVVCAYWIKPRDRVVGCDMFSALPPPTEA